MNSFDQFIIITLNMMSKAFTKVCLNNQTTSARYDKSEFECSVRHLIRE